MRYRAGEVRDQGQGRQVEEGQVGGVIRRSFPHPKAPHRAGLFISARGSSGVCACAGGRCASIVAGMSRDRPTTGLPAAPLRLRALIGPYIDVFEVEPGGRSAIGRGTGCEICLVSEAVCAATRRCSRKRAGGS